MSFDNDQHMECDTQKHHCLITRLLEKQGKLKEAATIRKFRIVQTEGLRQVIREVIHYDLQRIIAVGFKVSNDRTLRFRKWTG